jgi:murein L,D-transpeptidase YcbB/YkuD
MRQEDRVSRMRTLLLFGIVFLGTFLVVFAIMGRGEREASRMAASQLQQALTRPAPAFLTAHHDGAHLWKVIRQFYEQRGFAPAWIDGTRPRRQLDALLAAIEGAESHGLDPQLYDLKLLSEARANLEPRPFARDGFKQEVVAPLDLRLTSAWFAYASDLATGVTDRPHADPLWRIKPRTVDLLPVLAAAVEENRVAESLDALAPQHAEYRRLREAIARYRDKPKQYRAVAINLERWRWFPDDLGDRHIRVNVPAYHFEVREGDRTAFDMRVIVGARDNPTPIFSDTMTTIVFSPYWNVPAGIASDETLPAVLSDPEFLARNNIEVVGTSGEVIDPQSIDWTRWTDTLEEQDEESDDEGEEEAEPKPAEEFPYRFRQRPGTSNSLGLVKFLFPNAFDVYLHDTPADELFKKKYRALSHGCVRLEDPVRLAEYLLRETDWNSSRIEKAMHAGAEKHVKLPEAIPVHLMYWTAVAGDGGDVEFFPDIYGYDERQWRVYQSRIERVKQKKAAVERRAGGSISGASEPAVSPQRHPPRSDGGSPRRATPRAGTASR